MATHSLASVKGSSSKKAAAKKAARVYTFLDLFAGAGGISCGLEMTGRMKCIAGIDTWDAALETLGRNHPHVSAFSGPTDIHRLSGDAILDHCGQRPDLVVGGPPCQGISAAGPRKDDDPRNERLWDFVRLVAELKPQAVLMENVPRITVAAAGNSHSFADEVASRFERVGYECRFRVLSAEFFGVPQRRKRAFFLARPKGLPPIDWPRPTHGERLYDGLFDLAAFITAGEALSDLPSPTWDEPQDYASAPRSAYQTLMREGSDGVHNHIPAVHKPEMLAKLQKQTPGTRLYPQWNHSWFRLHPDLPAPTVKENHRAPFVHMFEPRVTTPRECARLQSFPDHYIFSGSKSSQLTQIGNAVPPLLVRALGDMILKWLDAHGSK